MERVSCNFQEHIYQGAENIHYLKSALADPETIFIFDADGIIVNSPAEVYRIFNTKVSSFDVTVNPMDADHFHYLTKIAKLNNLPQEVIEKAEEDWYKNMPLYRSEPYDGMRKVVDETIGLSGRNRNYVLTARMPKLSRATHLWFCLNLPKKIPQDNILIRGKNSSVKSDAFKVGKIKEKAETTTWVVFFDDSTKFVKSVSDANIDNCVVVNVPIGKIRPDFSHERLIVLGRYPEKEQSMYPLLDLIRRTKRS